MRRFRGRRGVRGGNAGRRWTVSRASWRKAQEVCCWIVAALASRRKQMTRRMKPIGTERTDSAADGAVGSVLHGWRRCFICGGRIRTRVFVRPRGLVILIPRGPVILHYDECRLPRHLVAGCRL